MYARSDCLFGAGLHATDQEERSFDRVALLNVVAQLTASRKAIFAKRTSKYVSCSHRRRRRITRRQKTITIALEYPSYRHLHQHRRARVCTNPATIQTRSAFSSELGRLQRRLLSMPRVGRDSQAGVRRSQPCRTYSIKGAQRALGRARQTNPLAVDDKVYVQAPASARLYGQLQRIMQRFSPIYGIACYDTRPRQDAKRISIDR